MTLLLSTCCLMKCPREYMKLRLVRAQLMPFSSSSSSSESFPPSPRRRRHQFRKDMNEIPSFQEFQQQQHVRRLYRRYLRLIYPLASRDELLHQIRREFRQTSTSDSWQIKRALSEGNRRLKELTAMLGNSVKADASDKAKSETQEVVPPSSSSDVATTSSDWPWKKAADSKRPLPFPKKSGI